MPNRIRNQGIQGTQSSSEAGSSRNPARKNSTPIPAPVSGQRERIKMNAKKSAEIDKLDVEKKKLETEMQELRVQTHLLQAKSSRNVEDKFAVYEKGEKLREELQNKNAELLSKINVLIEELKPFRLTSSHRFAGLKSSLQKDQQNAIVDLVFLKINYFENQISRYTHLNESREVQRSQPIDVNNPEASKRQREVVNKLIQATVEKQIDKRKEFVEFVENVSLEEMSKEIQETLGKRINQILLEHLPFIAKNEDDKLDDVCKKATTAQNNLFNRIGHKEDGEIVLRLSSQASEMSEIEEKEVNELYTIQRNAVAETLNRSDSLLNFLDKILSTPGFTRRKKDDFETKKNEVLRLALKAQYALPYTEMHRALRTLIKIDTRNDTGLHAAMNSFALYFSMFGDAFDEYKKKQPEKSLTLTRDSYEVAKTVSKLCEEIAHLFANISDQLNSKNFPQKDFLQACLKNLKTDSLKFQQLMHKEMERFGSPDLTQNEKQTSSKKDEEEVYLQNLFEKHLVKQDVTTNSAAADASDIVKEDEDDTSVVTEQKTESHTASEVSVTEKESLEALQSSKLLVNTNEIKKLERKLNNEYRKFERKAEEYRDKADEQIMLQSLSSMQMYMQLAICEIKNAAANRTNLANEFKLILSRMEPTHPDYGDFFEKEAQLRKDANAMANAAVNLAVEKKKLLVNGIRAKCTNHPPSSHDFRALYEMGAIAKIVPSPRKVDDKLDKDGNILKNPYTNEPMKDYFQSFEIHLKGEAQLKDGALSFASSSKGAQKNICFVAHFHYKNADSEEVLEAHFKTQEQANKGRLYVMSEDEAGRDTKIHRSPFKKSEDVINIIKTMSENNTQGKGKAKASTR